MHINDQIRTTLEKQEQLLDLIRNNPALMNSGGVLEQLLTQQQAQGEAILHVLKRLEVIVEALRVISSDQQTLIKSIPRDSEEEDG